MQTIKDTVELEKISKNYIGTCPFCRNRSFFYSPSNIFFCACCRKQGDEFDFYKNINRLSFKEACQHFGIIPEKTSTNAENLIETIENVSKYYIATLGDSAKKYLESRNVAQSTVNFFQIGYAPNLSRDENLFFHGEYKNLIDAGIIFPQEFSRFRGRVMIPVKNHFGSMIGFCGRILKTEAKEAKYLNSPDTEIFKKSSTLFNLNNAIPHILDKDEVIICEGHMDAIASHQFGIKNIVASGGTALTEKQINLIGKYTKNVKLCFDMDKAGRDATIRASEMFLENGFHVEIILIKDAKDIDELIQKNPQSWENPIITIPRIFAYFQNWGMAESFKPTRKIEKSLIEFISTAINTKISRVIPRILTEAFLKDIADEKFYKDIEEKRQIISREKAMAEFLPDLQFWAIENNGTPEAEKILAIINKKKSNTEFPKVSMQTILDYEGIKTNHNRCACPLCRANNVSTLSFQGEFFKCWKCNESGGSALFIMKLKHFDYQKAVEYLNRLK